MRPHRTLRPRELEEMQELRRAQESSWEEGRRREEERRRREEDDLKREKDEEERNAPLKEPLCRQHKIKAQHIRLVRVDECRLIEFTHGKKCLAAVGLNGPIVVIIVSYKAAIIANIAPYDNFYKPSEKDLKTSIAHAARGMDHMIMEFTENRKTVFPDGYQPYGVIVARTNNGVVMFPQVVNMIEQKVEALNLSRELRKPTYEPDSSEQPSGLQGSTVHVYGLGIVPEVYVNHQLIERPPSRGFSINPSGAIPPSAYAGHASFVDHTLFTGFAPPASFAPLTGYAPSAGHAPSADYGLLTGNAPSTGYGLPIGNAPSASYGPPTGNAPSIGYGPPAGYAPSVDYASTPGYGPPIGNAPSAGYGLPTDNALSVSYRPSIDYNFPPDYDPLTDPAFPANPLTDNAPPIGYASSADRASSAGHGPAVEFVSPADLHSFSGISSYNYSHPSQYNPPDGSFANPSSINPPARNPLSGSPSFENFPSDHPPGGSSSSRKDTSRRRRR